MKLTRNAATTFDSEKSEHRRNRGRFHFYQVEAMKRLDMDSPVFETPDQFIEFHTSGKG